jgi:phage terminase small subunit
MALTYKQRRFCAEYLRDQNGCAAAIRAGYSVKGATVAATRLLANDSIRENIEGRVQRVEKTAEVELDVVLVELKRILLADPSVALNPSGGFLPMKEWPLDLRRAVSGMDVEELWAGRGEEREQVGSVKKVKFWSKTHAAEQLLRTLGAFQDRLGVDVTNYTDLVRGLVKSEISTPDTQNGPEPGQREAIEGADGSGQRVADDRGPEGDSGISSEGQP